MNPRLHRPWCSCSRAPALPTQGGHPRLNFSAVDAGPRSASLTDLDPSTKRAIALHEGAHALAALAVGRSVERVTLDRAHVVWSAGAGSGLPATLVALVPSVAGHVGEMVGGYQTAFPPHGLLQAFLNKARRGNAGDCDRCYEADYLVRVMDGMVPDAEIILRWRDQFVLALSLLSEPTVRAALDRLAAALLERITLTGGAIAEIVDAAAVRAVAFDLWSRR